MRSAQVSGCCQPEESHATRRGDLTLPVFLLSPLGVSLLGPQKVRGTVSGSKGSEGDGNDSHCQAEEAVLTR